MSTVPPQQSYEQYSKHHSEVFNSLRRQIKKDAQMFAFGPPTPQVLMLIFKVYHENIIRSILQAILDVKVDALKEGTKVVKGGIREKLKCMLGIFEEELTDAEYESGKQGKLYITISESPGTGEGNIPSDDTYMQKRRALFNLLKSANIEVKFEEEGSPLAKKPHVELTARWRRTPETNLGNDYDDADWNTLPSYDLIKKTIMNSDMKDSMFLESSDDPKKVNIYDRRIRDYPMTVYFVDSWDYLIRRRPIMDKGVSTGLYSGPTFRPFKKYKQFEVESPGKKNKKWMAECNNGHLCTESKLFAYSHLHNIKPRTFLAYWIGANEPPAHIIRGYCYRTTHSVDELKKLLVDTVDKETLNTLGQFYRENNRGGILKLIDTLGNKGLILRIIDSYDKEIEDEKEMLRELMLDSRPPLQMALLGNGTPPEKEFTQELEMATTSDKKVKLDEVLKSVLQPSAVVCPGCFANIQDYKDGKMHMWNGRDCYFTRDSILQGGKQTKKQKKRITKKRKLLTKKTTRR